MYVIQCFFFKSCDSVSYFFMSIYRMLCWKKKEKGEIQFSGGEDVLTTALESREHSGRVRAVGGYITPKQYFKLPREKKIRMTKEELMARDRQRDEKTQALQEEIAQLKALMLTNGVAQSPMQSEKASYQPENKLVQDLDKDEECVLTDAHPKPTPPTTKVN